MCYRRSTIYFLAVSSSHSICNVSRIWICLYCLYPQKICGHLCFLLSGFVVPFCRLSSGITWSFYVSPRINRLNSYDSSWAMGIRISRCHLQAIGIARSYRKPLKLGTFWDYRLWHNYSVTPHEINCQWMAFPGRWKELWHSKMPRESRWVPYRVIWRKPDIHSRMALKPYKVFMDGFTCVCYWLSIKDESTPYRQWLSTLFFGANTKIWLFHTIIRLAMRR